MASNEMITNKVLQLDVLIGKLRDGYKLTRESARVLDMTISSLRSDLLYIRNAIAENVSTSPAEASLIGPREDADVNENLDLYAEAMFLDLIADSKNTPVEHVSVKNRRQTWIDTDFVTKSYYRRLAWSVLNARYSMQ